MEEGDIKRTVCAVRAVQQSMFDTSAAIRKAAHVKQIYAPALLLSGGELMKS